MKASGADGGSRQLERNLKSDRIQTGRALPRPAEEEEFNRVQDRAGERIRGRDEQDLTLLQPDEIEARSETHEHDTALAGGERRRLEEWTCRSGEARRVVIPIASDIDTEVDGFSGTPPSQDTLALATLALLSSLLAMAFGERAYVTLALSLLMYWQSWALATEGSELRKRIATR